ncbi:MAG: hypothetical protein AB7N53_15505 [Candidatus Binatia bacterium]
MIAVSLLGRLEARYEGEAEADAVLRDALLIADDEPATAMWFALRLAPSTSCIFAGFPGQVDRRSYLTGRIVPLAEGESCAGTADLSGRHLSCEASVMGTREVRAVERTTPPRISPQKCAQPRDAALAAPRETQR